MGSPNPRKEGSKLPVLEDKLRHQLSSTCVVILVRGLNLPERCRPWIYHWGGEEWVVQGVNKLHAELEFHSFADLDVFTQPNVHVVDCIYSYVTETQRQRAQVVHRSSTVCISSCEPTASRIPSNNRNESCRVEPLVQRLLTLR